MKDKGFTLVELLAAIVIVALLVFIGMYTVSNVFDSTKDNYYKSLENTLSIAGNEYFNDNRDDKPIDDYNFVDLKTLENHNYIDELKAYDGETKCDPKSGVYIYNTDNGTSYEVCLICGEYTPKEGSLCGGTKFGVINITGNINSPTGPYYNPLLSYSGTSWIDAGNIYITFSYKSEGETLTEYRIFNANSNTVFTSCKPAQGKTTCQLRMDKTGSYFVEGYNGSKKVANRKYFNIKLDNTSPSFAIKNTDTEFLLDDDEILYTYENEIININDDNGYKEVTYTLTRYNPTKERNTEIIKENEDMMSKDLKIIEPLASGQYDLYIYVKDFAGNEGRCTNSSTHIRFYIRYYVGLQYFDSTDNKHDAGRFKVYTYGKYDLLPDRVTVNNANKEVTWYKNSNFVLPIVDQNTLVEKTGYHVLYGRELKDKGTFRARCLNPTYNGSNQQLASIPDNEKNFYRLVVYTNGQLQNNSGRNAGNYTVIAILNKGYTWNDGTTAAKAIQCEIKPYPIDLSKNPCKTDLVYNGSSQLLTTSESCSGSGSGTGYMTCITNGNIIHDTNLIEAGASYSPTHGTNAGNYDVTYKLTSSNYIWSDGSRSNKTFTCTIQRKSVQKPGSPCISGLIYNAQNQILFNTDGLVNSDGSGYFVKPDPSSPCEYCTDEDTIYHAQRIGGGSEAGSYANAFILGKNYRWSDGSTSPLNFTCVISPATVSWPGPTSIEYCGEPSDCPTIDASSTPGVVTAYNNYFYGSEVSLSAKIEKIDKTNDQYTASVSFYSGGSSIGSSAPAGELEYSSFGFTPSNDLVISPSTITISITDSVAPKCDTVTVSSDGTITYTATDNYQFDDGSTTATKTETATAAGDYSTTFKDKAGNEVTCSVTVKKQKATATCSTGKSCESAGCQTYNSCRNSVCGCDTYSEYGSYGRCNLSIALEDEYTDCDECRRGLYKCRFRTCTQYASCVNNSCSCNTFKTSISTCGCATWGNYTDWVDDNSCTVSESTDHSTLTTCQYAKA